MPASVRCPFCSAAMTAEAGQSVTCTACGATFVAQGSAPPPPPPIYTPPSAGPVASPGDMPCPMCGEMIKAGAKVCRFCKAQLGPMPTGMPPAPPPPPYGYGYNAPPPQKKSNCLLWIILGVIGGGILLCVGVPALLYIFGKDEIAKETDRANLEQHLSKEVKETFGTDATIKDDKELQKKLEKLDHLRGTDFWRKMATEAGNDQACFCAAALFKGDQRVYRGPKKPISEYGPDDPIGHCPPGYHKDGVWIIYKNGKFEFVSESSEEFKKAKELLQE